MDCCTLPACVTTFPASFRSRYSVSGRTAPPANAGLGDLVLHVLDFSLRAADHALGLALRLLGLAARLHLVVVGRVADALADRARDLVGLALDLVLFASHVGGSSLMNSERSSALDARSIPSDTA